MRQTIIFRRVVEASITFEVERQLTRKEATGWARFGWCGKSAVDQAIEQNTVGVDVQKGAWEVMGAEPDFAPEEEARPKRRVAKA